MTLDLSDRNALPRRLLPRYVRAFAVTESIRLEDEIDAFRGVNEIERSRVAQSTRANGAVAALVPASASHIKFVNHHALVHVSHPDVHGQDRAADSKRSEEEAADGIAAIDQGKFAFHQPA